MNNTCLHARKVALAILTFTICLWALPSSAQQPETPAPVTPAAGSITGNIVDSSGAAIVGAKVTLARDPQSQKQEIMSGDDGQYSLSAIPSSMRRINA